MDRPCKKCGEPSLKNRRLCQKCNAKRVKKYYSKRERNKKRTKICPTCGEPKVFHRYTQIECGDCYRGRLKNVATNNYVYDKAGRCKHRVIAEKLIGRKLSSNEVVHHINENPKDNRVENLLVLSRHMHGKLHFHLRRQRAIWEQSHNENQENCWDSLRVLQTTAWLEMTSAKVIKLEELANQQPSTA